MERPYNVMSLTMKNISSARLWIWNKQSPRISWQGTSMATACAISAQRAHNVPRQITSHKNSSAMSW